MDNPTTESNQPLNLDSAAQAFSQVLDVEPEQEREQPASEQNQPTEQQEQPQGDPNAAPEPQDQMVTVKIDGKEVEVPLSELKNGYQRQQDYTKKTMEVSEQRKAAEAETQRAQYERQQYAQNLHNLRVQAEAALQSQSQIDWDRLIAENPQEALRQKHLMDQRQAQLQQVYAEQQRVAQAIQADQRQGYQRHLSEQHQQLVDKLPEWKDEAKAKAESAAIRDYLLGQGYDADAVNSVNDSRAVVIARKAMLYDQMISKADAATKKVANLPTRVEQPGSGASPNLDRRTAAFQKLSKTGRVEDAAQVFAQFL